MVFGMGKKKEAAAPPTAPAPATEDKSEKLLTTDMQDQLLSDPTVKALMQQAGDKGLSDPLVQKQLMAACKDKFPEYATNAGSQVSAWASDPATQEKAKEVAGVAAAYAAAAGDVLMKQIEQGPAGVRVIAFFAGLASVVDSIWGLLTIIHPLSVNPVAYLVRCYTLVFSITCMLFEAKPEWLIAIQDKTGFKISSYQDLLLDNAKFMALAGGRGLFYIFLGSLWLCAASLEHLINFMVGMFLLLVGFIHLLMHCGVAPIDMAHKMRDGYKKVGDGVASARGAKMEEGEVGKP